MANNNPDQPKRHRPWLGRFMLVGFLAGTCIGTIINEVAGIHGATLVGAPIGLGLGFLVGIWVGPHHNQ